MTDRHSFSALANGFEYKQEFSGISSKFVDRVTVTRHTEAESS